MDFPLAIKMVVLFLVTKPEYWLLSLLQYLLKCYLFSQLCYSWADYLGSELPLFLLFFLFSSTPCPLAIPMLVNISTSRWATEGKGDETPISQFYHLLANPYKGLVEEENLT